MEGRLPTGLLPELTSTRPSGPSITQLSSRCCPGVVTWEIDRMALITPGPLIGTISGSAGGTTFSHGRGGPYIRTRTVPVNPNTVYQQAVRGFLSQLTVLWSTLLTASQRAQWDAYAEAVLLPNAQGEPRNVGGLGMYIRSNVPRLQAGLSRVDDGPTNHTLAALTNPGLTSASVATGDLTFTFDNTDAWANEDGGALFVYGSRAINVTRNFFKGPYRYAEAILGDPITAPTSPATATSPFPIVLGLNSHVRFRAVAADGRVSSDFRLFVAGTA
jgi:hypothetical protein